VQLLSVLLLNEYEKSQNELYTDTWSRWSTIKKYSSLIILIHETEDEEMKSRSATSSLALAA